MSELDPFVAALRARTERARVASVPTPDVVDVVDRALARDPDGVAPGLREVIDGEDSEPEVAAPELGAFTTALRGRTEAAARDRRLVALPRTPRPQGRTRGWPLLVAAAAAVVLVAGLSSLRGTSVMRAESEPSGSASERVAPGERAGHQAQRRDPPPTRPPSRRVVPEAEPVPVEAVVEDEVPDEPSEPDERVRKPRASLDELEAQAQAQWSSGDLAGAEKALRAVARRAGRARRAELAYADLFALSSQRGGPDARAKVWKEYLRKFPRGRFADDVRAGLCRREAAAGRAACWQRYLAAHPSGAHADEARKVTSTPSP